MIHDFGNVIDEQFRSQELKAILCTQTAAEIHPVVFLQTKKKFKFTHVTLQIVAKLLLNKKFYLFYVVFTWNLILFIWFIFIYLLLSYLQQFTL